MEAPNDAVMAALHNLFKYINHTKDKHLILGSKQPIKLIGFSDSNFEQSGDCGIKVEEPVDLYVDNLPAVTLSDEGNHLKRSKHFIVRMTFVKDQVELGIFKVNHIDGSLNFSDILTKVLRGHLLKTHTDGILGYRKT